MWCWSEQHLLCFPSVREEIGKDSMKLHPEHSQGPLHVQGLLQLQSPLWLRLRAQRSFEQERLFFWKAAWCALVVCWDLCQGQVNKGPSSLQAKPPKNAPGNGAVLPRATGVTGRPRWALRMCWEVQRPLRICWELAGLSPQVLYDHWCYIWWRAVAGSCGSSGTKPVRFTSVCLRSTQGHKLPVLITLTPWTLHLMSVFCLSRIQRKSHTSLNGRSGCTILMSCAPLVNLFPSPSVCLGKGTGR